jgi:uncharacterized protein YjcR
MSLNKQIKDRAYYADLKHKAAVMFIKHGLSAKEINHRLGISMNSISIWRQAGKWDDLRPDLSDVKEYKAAHLYLNEGLTTGEIAMKLSISEVTVRYWIDLNRWDMAKQLTGALDAAAKTINLFCEHFTKSFPHLGAEIEIVRTGYINRNIKQLKPLHND